MDINLHFTNEDWDRIARDWFAWWSGELKRPLVVTSAQDPPTHPDAPQAPHFTSELPLDMPVDQVLDLYERELERTHFIGDAWPKWWPNFGPGIMAGFVGARVRSVPETVWFEPSGALPPIDDVQITRDEGNVWWQRIADLTAAAVARWGDRVSVAHTDLGGNLDILASLRTTEQLLFDVYDAPEAVERLVGAITVAWLAYYDSLHHMIEPAGRGTTPWAAIWSPWRCYMLQCDFAYMISPKMFERFVLPDLAACCASLDHGFYHLDGKNQIPHLEMLLSLDRLRGIQWVPGDGAPPPEEWLPLLKRIVDGDNRCQLYVSPEGALKIVRALGGKGFALGIAPTSPWTAEDARDFTRYLLDEAKRGSGPE